MHEIAHYFQDLTTGMGAWDFLQQRSNVAKCYGYLQAAQSVEIPGVREAMILAAQEQMKSLSSECAFVPIRDYPVEFKQRLQDKISTAIGKRLPEEDMAPFLVENMLESEAAAVTYSAIRDLGMTDEQWEIAKDSSSLWLLAGMPEPYRHTFELIAAIFERWMGGSMSELREQYGRGVVDFFDRLMIFVIDLCWAFPDPDYFRDSGVQRCEYEPGLKLARLLVRLQTMTSTEAGIFQQALVNDIDKAEELLIAKCGFSYRSARQVYQAWSRFLEKVSESDDNRLLRARREVCELRAKQPALVWDKHLANFLDAKIDLHYMADGIQTYWTSPHFLDPDETSIVVADLMSLNRDLLMADYLTNRSSFVCPMAESRICDAATETCKTGITDPKQFPETKVCSVRRSAELNQIPLGRL